MQPAVWPRWAVAYDGVWLDRCALFYSRFAMHAMYKIDGPSRRIMVPAVRRPLHHPPPLDGTQRNIYVHVGSDLEQREATYE